jgi:hypothetical protein
MKKKYVVPNEEEKAGFELRIRMTLTTHKHLLESS